MPSLTPLQAAADSSIQSEPITQTYHILTIEDLQKKRAVPLNFATYSLGRDSSNTIQISDPGVSRQHLILLRVPLQNRQYIYRLMDGDSNGKASLNGVTVNGVSCAQKDLNPGDIIHIGEITSITYHHHAMTSAEYDTYFKKKKTEYRSIQEEVMDPVLTMTTVLTR